MRGSQQLLAVVTTLFITTGCDQATENTAQANEETDSLAIRQAIAARMPLVMADGRTARLARDGGLLAVSGILDSGVTLLWPGHGMISGVESVSGALGTLGSGAADEIFWQPLMLRSSTDLSFVVGIASVRGSLSTSQSLELGKYLAVWRQDHSGMRLLAFMPGQLDVTPIPTTGDFSSHPTTPLSLSAEVASADSIFREQLTSEGPSRAFGNWYAPDGLSFATGGTVGFGPEAIARQLAGAGKGSRWEMHPLAGSSSGDGTLAWVAGVLVITPRDAAIQRWNYMVFWERQQSGDYRLIAALTNPG